MSRPMPHTVTGRPTPLAAAAIHEDFPLLDQTNARGQRIVFLDSPNR